ncbi:MAG: hypothetical protein KF773_42360 [Deltaproteobacteria bacterium]|nr:hypothetical protein [Deltaproteobacteria bacterium]MCW5805534.1 hypothetical protein [Deltaproteobacteria bacterium]
MANVVVGKPDVKPSAPSHVPGVFQGNHPHAGERGKGIHEVDGAYAEGTARRSTGIRPKAHDVIDPRMPRLSPA